MAYPAIAAAAKGVIGAAAKSGAAKGVAKGAGAGGKKAAGKAAMSMGGGGGGGGGAGATTLGDSGGGGGQSGFLKGKIGKLATSSTANALGATLGAVQSIVGHIKQKKADAMLPGMEDPEQRALQRQFARQKRSLQTGTADNASRTALRQMMQSGVKESFKYGAGAGGLNNMNRMYMQGLLGLNQQSSDDAVRYAGMESDITNTMAQRKLELGMEKYDRQQARAASLKTKGARNLGSSISRIIQP